MIVRSRLKTPPETEPVSVDEAKEQSVVTHDEHDAMFERLITAARQLAEQRTGRALITQTWRQSQEADGNTVCLRRWPVLEVVKVADDEGELAAEEYQAELGDHPAVIASRPLVGTVTVEYQAGYGAEADAVPGPIRQWMLATIASMYEHRETAIAGTITASHDFLDGLLDDYVVTPT